MLKIPFTILAGILILSFLGCEDSLQKKLIEAAVRDYNETLVHAYTTGEFDKLKDITSDKEYKKTSIYIMSYSGQMEQINARLLRLDIDKITIRSTDADVFTSEQWEYSRSKIDTSEITFPNKTYHYRVNYILLGSNNKWKVDRLKIISEDSRN